MAVIGRDTIEVVYDGSGMPAEAERLGREAGRDAGEEHAKAFDEEAKKGFDKTGKDLEEESKKRGHASGKGFADEFEKGTGEDLGTRLRKNVDKAFDGLDADFNKYVDGLDADAARLGEITGGRAGAEHAKAFNDEVVGGFDQTAQRIEDDAAVRGERTGRRYADEFATATDQDLGEKLRANVDRAFDGIDRDFNRSIDNMDVSPLTRGFSNLKASVEDYDRQLLISKGNTEDYRTSIDTLGERLSANVDRAFAALAGDIDGFDGKLHESTTHIDEHVAKVRELPPAWKTAGDAVTHFEGDIDGLGEHLRNNVTTAFDELEAKFHSTMDALPPLDDGFQRAYDAIDVLRDPLRNTKDDLHNLGTEMDNSEGRLRRARTGFGNLLGDLKGFGGSFITGLGGFFGNLGDDIDGAGGKADKAAGAFGKLGGSFGSLGALSTPALIVGLIVGLLAPLSVLAAAAAGGLTILGASALSAVGGLAAFYAVFQGISNMDTKTIDALPGQMKRNAQAWQDMIGVYGKKGFEPGKLFTELQDGLTHAFLGTKNLDTAMSGFMKATLPKIEGALKPVATALGDLFKEVLTGLGSKNGLTDIEGLIHTISALLPGLGRIFGDTFSIISQLLIDATPFANKFQGDLDKMLKSFLDFLRSPTGKDDVTQWLKNTIRIVGDAGKVIGDAVTAIGKLAANPENISNTATALQSIGNAMPGIAQIGQDLSVITPVLASALKVIGEVAGGIGAAIDPIVSGAEDMFLGLAVFLTGIVNAIHAVIQGIITNLGDLGKVMWDIFTGNWGAVAGDVQKTNNDLKKSFNQMTAGLGEALGNGSAAFDTLDAKTKKASLSIVGSLGETGKGAKDAAGQLAEIAAIGGVSLSKLSKDKSWQAIAEDLGLTGSAAKQFVSQFSDAIDGRAVKSVKDLNSEGKSNLNALSKNLGLTGKDASTFEAAVAVASGGSKTKLSELARDQSLNEVIHTLGLTGAQADAFRKLFGSSMSGSAASADGTKGHVDGLRQAVDKIHDKGFSITEKGAEAARAAVQSVVDSLNGIGSRHFTVTGYLDAANIDAALASRGLKGALGGIVGPGGFVAGGQSVGTGRRYAYGGLVTSPTWLNPSSLVGEDGMEAIVPLTKPISQVDPSVRELAMIARGLSPYATASGSAGKSVTIAPGAIQVTEAGNGRTTASAVLDRLAAKLGG